MGYHSVLLFLTAVGIIYLLFASVDIFFIFRTRNWRRAQAYVSSSKWHDADGPTQTVRVTYTVGATAITVHPTVCFGIDSNKFKLGDSVDILYNPNNINSCVVIDENSSRFNFLRNMRNSILNRMIAP